MFSKVNTIGILGVVCIAGGGCANAVPTKRNDPRPVVAQARIVAYAHEINLRASDVPKLIAARYPWSGETALGPIGAYVERCDSEAVDSGGAIGLRSTRFHSVSRSQTVGDSLFPLESVQSAIYVMGSSGAASRELAAAATARGRQCLMRSLLSKDAIVRPEGAKVGVPVLSKIKISSVRWHMARALVYRWHTTAESATEEPRTGAPNYYQDMLAFTVGPAIIVLNTVSSPEAFATTEEMRLLSVLYKRAMMREQLYG
jgi:hypothetical protein